MSVSDNNLVELPESISLLSKLDKLAIHNNKLVRLPVGMANLKSLKILYMTVEVGSGIELEAIPVNSWPNINWLWIGTYLII